MLAAARAQSGKVCTHEVPQARPYRRDSGMSLRIFRPPVGIAGAGGAADAAAHSSPANAARHATADYTATHNPARHTAQSGRL